METINVRKLTNIAMTAGGEKAIKQVIHRGQVVEWVGFGWIDIREPTAEDRTTIPQAVYDDGTPA